MFQVSFSRPLGYLLLAGLAFSPVTASALSFGVGPVGGMNFADAMVDNHDETDGRQGLALGGRAEFGVTSPYSVVIEGMYVQKGARFDVVGITTRGDFDYVEIPILVKAKFGAIKYHAFAFAGPSIGINVGTEGAMGSLDGNFEDESAPVVFSGDIGVGGEFQIMPFIYLSGDVRYSHGFSNALSESVGNIDEWKSRDIRALVGLLFHLTQ